jgi:hypothetical protein
VGDVDWECGSFSGEGGIRTPLESSEELALSETRGAESGALVADPDLNHIIAAWPTLPDPIKTAILAMVRATVRAVPGNHAS